MSIKNFFVHFVACFILNREKRKAFRQHYSQPKTKRILQSRVSVLEDEFRKLENENISKADLLSRIESLEREELCRKNKIQQMTAEKIKCNVQDFGKNNSFVLIHENGFVEQNPQLDGLTIIFYGNNNRVELHAPIKFINCRFKLGNEAEIVIQKTRYNICDVFIDAPMKPGNKLIIGENFSCGHTVFYLGEDPNVCIKIGNDCMFSVQNFFRPDDGHKITQQGKNEQINTPKDIVLGNHVWLGMRNMILKGTIIPDNCIIATSSVVNKVFESKNCIIGGVPAKVLKCGIEWHR